MNDAELTEDGSFIHAKEEVRIKSALARLGPAGRKGSDLFPQMQLRAETHTLEGHGTAPHPLARQITSAAQPDMTRAGPGAKKSKRMNTMHMVGIFAQVRANHRARFDLKTKRASLFSALREMELFADVDDAADLSALLAQGNQLALTRGAHAYTEGTPATNCVFAIISGSFEEYTLDAGVTTPTMVIRRRSI